MTIYYDLSMDHTVESILYLCHNQFKGFKSDTRWQSRKNRIKKSKCSNL